MKNLLIVTAVSEVLLDKNEREYKRVTISQAPKYATLPNGVTVAIKAKLKSTSVIAYENNYLEERDMLFDSVKGDYIEGSLISRNTTPYDIDGRTVTSATCPVFADDSEAIFETEVAKAFKASAYEGKDQPLRFELVSSDGEIMSEVSEEVSEEVDLTSELG